MASPPPDQPTLPTAALLTLRAGLFTTLAACTVLADRAPDATLAFWHFVGVFAGAWLVLFFLPLVALPWRLHPYVHGLLLVLGLGLGAAYAGPELVEAARATTLPALIGSLPHLMGAAALLMYSIGVLFGVGYTLANRQQPEDPECGPELDEPAEVTASDAALPRGGEAGWWDGYRDYGPGHAHLLIHRIHNIDVWPCDPWVQESPPLACSECGATRDIALMWPETRPDLSRFVCECGCTWRVSLYAEGSLIAGLLDQPSVPGSERATIVADADPRAAYTAEYLLREAGNTKPPEPADD